MPGRSCTRGSRRIRRSPRRRAAGRCDAGPTGARSGGDERRDDRRRRLAGDVPDAVRTDRERRRGRAGALRRDPRRLAGGGRPRRTGPQPGSRGDRRGADRAAPGPTGRDRRRPPRATDPVRRGPRGDPPVRRDGRARRRGRGLRLQVGREGHQRRRAPPARRREDARRRRGRAAARRPGRPRRPPLVRGPAHRQTAPHDATGLVTLETLDELSAAR